MNNLGSASGSRNCTQFFVQVCQFRLQNQSNAGQWQCQLCNISLSAHCFQFHRKRRSACSCCVSFINSFNLMFVNTDLGWRLNLCQESSGLACCVVSWCVLLEEVSLWCFVQYSAECTGHARMYLNLIFTKTTHDWNEFAWRIMKHQVWSCWRTVLISICITLLILISTEVVREIKSAV